MKKIVLGFCFLILMVTSTQGLTQVSAVSTRNVDYVDGNAALEGFLAYPTQSTGKLPAILLVHAWKGLGDYEKGRAIEMAQWGYVVFAIDMYGKGIRPQTSQEAGKMAGLYKGDRALMRSRAKAGLDYMSTLPQVDPTHIAATGFCFGGGVALELARSGAPLTSVASFHGNLDTPVTADAQHIKGKVLVMHGADDPYVTEEQVSAFRAEMKNAKTDWELVYLGNAVHAFTDPSAGNDPAVGAAYNPVAAKRAMALYHAFLTERVVPKP